jgi:sugar phosphate isomerase/epimerase
MTLNRRNFLLATTALPVWAALTADLLACNSWHFRAYFDTPQMHEYRDAKYPLLVQAEFPQFLADHFGIHNVEFLPQHFADTEPATVEKVKAGLKKASSRCCNLMGVEIPGGAFNKNPDRNAILKEGERWLGIAQALGSPSITIALNGKASPDPAVAAANLATTVDLAAKRGIQVLFHNDDIKTESAEILTAVIGKLGRNRTGTCPDFGNFATRSANYALAQLKMLAPYASTICHAKDGIADGGKFYNDDFSASLQVMRASGFKGLYSLEFEGLGEPVKGVRRLMNITEHLLQH